MLKERLDSVPRQPLGVFETPLDPLPRLSVALRRPGRRWAATRPASWST